MRVRASYGSGLLVLQAAMLLGGCDAPVAPVAAPEAKASPVPAAIPVSGPERLVLAFGDSLYAGYRLERGESLPDRLEDALRRQGIDATVVNAGVSGDTSAGGRRRLAFTLDRLERAPDLVVLGLGGNDVLRQVSPTETRANLTAMMAELERRGIPAVLTGMVAPPNLGPEFAARFNSIYPEIAEANEAVLDPFILDGVIGNRQLMLPDGIHPNARGVERIAARLAPLVADRLRAIEP